MLVQRPFDSPDHVRRSLRQIEVQLAQGKSIALT
jgi:hypothetical protein